MYNPKYSSVNDSKLIKDFILEHSFGTLVTNDGGELLANHYPFLLTEENNEITLWTHLARSNPQWQKLVKESLIIFTGPQAYISPTYYINKLNVPTWNYTAVHTKCAPEIVQSIELSSELMKKFVHFFENKNQTHWNDKLPEEFHDKLMKAIVWIKFKVISVEAKFKLSQNRDQIDYENVIKVISEKTSDNNQELLKYMKLTSPYLF